MVKNYVNKADLMEKQQEKGVIATGNVTHLQRLAENQ